MQFQYRKKGILTIVLLLICFVAVWAGTAVASEAGRKPENQGPRAFFPLTKYTFEPLFEGDDIKHDFIVENKGAAPLVIKNVRPD